MSDELEPPRPEPDFRVYVHHHDGAVDVTHAVMDVYDIAINSMNFGSGFLSTEEVGHIRTLGEAIGAQRFDYQHDKCLRCGHDFKGHTEPGKCSYTKIGPGVRDWDWTCSCAGFINGSYMLQGGL